MARKWVIMFGRERLEITFAPAVWARLEQIARTHDLPIGEVIKHCIRKGAKSMATLPKAEFYRRMGGAKPSNGRRR